MLLTIVFGPHGNTSKKHMANLISNFNKISRFSILKNFDISTRIGRVMSIVQVIFFCVFLKLTELKSTLIELVEVL